MSLKENLAEEWPDYDNKKVKDGRDARFFACTETWEVDYLREKIRKNQPSLKDEEINKAIKLCCQELRSPHPRKAFMECVGRRLGVPAT